MGNLLFRLCLILVVSLTAYSCRTDQFHENEKYQGGSKFQLVSKRISLDEARHKKQLIPELGKAKTEIAASSKNRVQGKNADFGNGITINTDEVIYIENGPNFHTYTFKVNRENAPENAPLENLLLTPQPDGSYRVFLIALNLSESDKVKIKNRQYVNYKNKSQVTELASVNFSSAAQRSNCTPEYYSYPMPCADANYRHLPGESCQLSGTPGEAYWGTGVFWNCQNIDEPVDHVITPSEGGGGGGGGTDPSDLPGECQNLATHPGEVGMVDPNGCNTGLPTEPNNPDEIDERTPCEVLKENSETPYIQTKLDSLKERVALTTSNRDHSETGITINKRGQLLKHKVFKKPKDVGISNAVTVEIELETWDILSAHNHYEGTFPVPQFGDIVVIYSGYYMAAPPRRNGYVSYVVNFNGTEYAFKMNDTSALDTLFAGLNQNNKDSTDEEDNKAYKKVYDIFLANGFKENKDYTENEALKILMKVLNDPKIGSGNGVHLYRKDKETKRWAKLKLKTDGEIDKDDCPL